jgi:maltose alpha-D-glucosyltransferase/alpha-amylase
VRVFLEAYETESEGACFYPGNEKDRKALLNAYMLNKAIYELGYEIHFRPDWIDVPLRALERYLNTGSLLNT